MIGFENKTKREAEANAVKNVSEVAVTPKASQMVQEETVNRLEYLGGLICSNEFAKMEVEEKINVLSDFSYYSQVLVTMP